MSIGQIIGLFFILGVPLYLFGVVGVNMENKISEEWRKMDEKMDKEEKP